ATRNTILSVLDHVGRHGHEWLRATRAADARAARLGGESVPLEYEATDRERTIDFRGYAWTRTPSDVSGALMTRYDETTPQLWRVPLRDELVPSRTAQAPRGGYVVPAAHADWVAAHLELHDVRFSRLAEPVRQADLETFRASAWTPAAASMEGRQRMALEGQWAGERRDVPAGSLFVPIAQPAARLVVALFEPQAPEDRKSTRLNSSHVKISYAVFCLKKKIKKKE